MATRDGLGQIWYADANGVITGYTPTADNVASAIIDAYNEHFGTDINIWTPETITLQVSDTVPNWNAYEKIHMNNIKVAVYIGSGGGVLGLVNNNVFTMYVVQNGNAIIINKNGVVIDTQQPANYIFENYAKNVLNEQGFQTSELETEVIEVSLGDTFPDYQEYLFIP